MNDLIATGAIYIGGYLTTKYVVNYALNKATEKAIEGTWSLSKKAANVAIDHLIKRENEETCEYLDYELIEIDPVNRDIVRVVNVIELPPNNETQTPVIKPMETPRYITTREELEENPDEIVLESIQLPASSFLGPDLEETSLD